MGVFVDETADIITERSAAAGLSFVQLHGDGARQALPNLPAETNIIYVLGATPDGVVQTLLPSQICAESKRLVCILSVCHNESFRLLSIPLCAGKRLYIHTFLCALFVKPQAAEHCGGSIAASPLLKKQLKGLIHKFGMQPEYILVDSMKGGSGVALDWEALQVWFSILHVRGPSKRVPTRVQVSQKSSGSTKSHKNELFGMYDLPSSDQSEFHMACAHCGRIPVTRCAQRLERVRWWCRCLKARPHVAGC